MFKFNIIIYLTLLLFTINNNSCKCSLDKFAWLSQKQEAVFIPKEDRGNPLIVLCHGLTSHPKAFKKLKKELESCFSDADVIALESVQNTDNKDLDQPTVVTSVPEQAQKYFRELKEKIPKEELEHRPMVLIGHSQGGLRAYSLYDQCKNDLNIKGIISLNTPWEGSPLLQATNELVHSLMQDPAALDEMKDFSKKCNEKADWMKTRLDDMLKHWKDLQNTKYYLGGLVNLMPEPRQNKWLFGDIHQKLRKECLPMLAIGGAESHFKNCVLQPTDHDFQIMTEKWSKLVCGINAKGKALQHDMVVPLYSQLALNVVTEDSENFERYIIKDALHDNVFRDDDNKNILNHIKMHKKVKDFIERVLPDQEQVEEAA